MAHPAIEEQLTIERYLTGALSHVDEDAFEDHALVCPRCLDELEADELLGQGIRTVAAGALGA